MKHLLLATLATSLTLLAQDQTQEIEYIDPTSVAINWDSVNGRSYFLQWSTDLLEWNYFPIIEYGDGTPNFSYGFGSNSDKFFTRLYYTDQPTTDAVNDDFDGDGVRNIDEITTLGGTDPFNGDSDGDGKSDWQEFAEGLDPKDGETVNTDLSYNIHQGSSAILPQTLINPNATDVLDVALSGSGFFSHIGSNQSGGPAYQFIDIESTGEALDFGGNDSAIVSRSLNFQFPFYDELHNQVHISIRGFLSLVYPGADQGIPKNFLAPVPNTGTHAGLIAPYMTTLDSGAEGTIYFQEFPSLNGAPAYAVIQWENIEFNFQGIIIQHSFQAVLREDGLIEFNYRKMPPVINNSYYPAFLIGVQSADSTQGRTAYWFDTANGNVPRGNFISTASPASIEYGYTTSAGPLQLTGANLEWQTRLWSYGYGAGGSGSRDLTLTTNPGGANAYTQNIGMTIIEGATDGDDNLSGTSINDVHLNGLAGNDTIAGNQGDDELLGESGNDILNGGTGDDSLNGGEGEDLYIIRSIDGNDTISEDQFSDFDRVQIEDFYWENVTISHPTFTQMTLNYGASNSLTINKHSAHASYPQLRFPDGLLASWDFVDRTYFLGVDRTLSSYPDLNSNGVADWLERQIFGSLQPNLDSTDVNPSGANGISDWWEIFYFGGLDISDGDFDDDGLTDLEEWQNNTNPTKTDTDGDGLDDKHEVDSNLVDPLVIDAGLDDADEDGLLAYQEAIYGSSDNNPDSDNDGFSDKLEADNGTTLNDDNSRPFDYVEFFGSAVPSTQSSPAPLIQALNDSTISSTIGDLGVIYQSNTQFHRLLGAIQVQEPPRDPEAAPLPPELYSSGMEFGVASASSNFARFDVRKVDEPFFFDLTLDSRDAYRYRMWPGGPDPSARSAQAFTSIRVPDGATAIGQIFSAANSGQIIVSSPFSSQFEYSYLFPLSFDSWSINYTGQDIVGPKNRKIALNGRPLPDQNPEQESETDNYSEQTYVDAFSLNLHHDISYAYTPLGASDLVMEARANTTETIWNNRSGIRPAESLTQPFGVAWGSNLCSYIEIVETRGQRSNAPITVNVVDESGRSQRFGTNDQEEFFAWPSAAVDKKTYLNKLERVGNNLVLTKKHGSTLTYTPSDAWFMYSTDRIEGSNSTRKHVYWRLSSITDRFGVTMNYGYSGSISLIPTSITSPQRPNQNISIQVDSTGRRVDSITDARNHTIYFDYTNHTLNVPNTNFSYDYTRLNKVRFPDGSDVDYTYEAVTDRETVGTRNTYHCHINLKSITDKRSNTHTFNYEFDRTREYFTGTSSRLSFSCSLRGVPLAARIDAENQLDARNRANFPGGTQNYRTQYGVPRNITSVVLPGGIGSSSFSKTSDTELTLGPDFTAVSGTEVTDTIGNRTFYNFGGVNGLIVNRSSTYSGGGSSSSKDWMIYYTTMEIHHGGREGQSGFLGKERFEYDVAAGMALSRMVDFSGNETTWQYSDNLSGLTAVPFEGASNLLTKWSDPTSKTDALGRTETYKYSNNFRIMEERTDVYGTVTSHTIDSLGRSTGMTVVDKDGTKLHEESYEYTETSLPAFKTKSTVVKFSSISGQAWEQNLVTQYVPNLTNGMVKDTIQDPDGLSYTTSCTYDNNNNKLTSNDGRGNTTSFTYDTLNRLTRVDYPVAGTSSGNVATFKEMLYDFNGNKAGEIDEEGNYTFYYRDALNRVTHSIIDMDGAGLPVKNANGIVPDSNRGTIGSADISSSVTYNAVNSPVTSTDPRGIVTRTVYDAIQRPTNVYTDDLGSGTVAASTTKTHTQLFYEDQLTINGVNYNANPGISGAHPRGFTPTRTVRHDAVRTNAGLESFTTYKVCDPLYRPIRQVAEFSKTGADFDENHQTTLNQYGAIVAGKEALESSVTDDRGKVTKILMDGRGRTVSVTDGFGSTLPATSETVYSSTGLVWKTIDPLDRESETEFDAVGRPVKAWSPDPISGVVNRILSSNGLTGSPMTETQYDANSNVVKTINPLGFEWDFTFDARNRKTDEYQPAVTDAENPASPVLNQRPHIQIAYNGVSKPISTTDARDNTTRSFYDRAYRVTDVITNPVTGNPSTDPDALSSNDILVETFYDKASNVVAVIDGNGNTTRNGYDALNRLVATAVDPVDGDPVDPSSGSFNAATYQGSSANDDIVVTNSYDDAGNLTRVTDGEDHSTAFRYDGLSRKTHTLWDVGTAVERVEYSAYDGLLLTAMTNPKLETTSYSYDDLHRLDDVTYIGRSADDRSMSYDLVGNLLSVSYPNETVANQVIRGCAQTYDKLNRVATETSNGVTHANTYDRAGNLRTLTYGQTNREITSVYDALNRLDNCSEAVGAATPRVTSYAYNLNGGVTRKTLPNSSYTDCVFDALNRKTSIINRLGNGTQIQRSVTEYDDQSNVTRLEEYTNSGTADQITVMLNDRAYRLDTETRTESATVTLSDYGYDKGSNRTSKSVSVNGGASQVSNYQFGTTSDGFNSNQLKNYNRPSTSDTVSFTYDANGNRLTRTVGADTDDYGYDYNNRLVSLDLKTSSDATKNGLYEYQYDHRTRRVLRDESAAGSDATRAVFSGGLSVQEVDEVGGSYNLTSPSVEYVRGSDYGGGVGGVLYTLRGGNSSFNYYNHRGDVLLKTNDAGVITWEARYEAFGTRTHEIGSNLDRQKANTKDEDPTGLLNEGMRYRDLDSGVFITRDPAGFVDGPNVYTYVSQNPWTYYDPYGLNKHNERSAKALERAADAVMDFNMIGAAEYTIESAGELALAGITGIGSLFGADDAGSAVADAAIEYHPVVATAGAIEEGHKIYKAGVDGKLGAAVALGAAADYVSRKIPGMKGKGSEIVEGVTDSARKNQKKSSKASNLEVVKPGTKEWDKTVKDMSNMGKGKVNVRTETATDAKKLLTEARGNMDRHKQYAKDRGKTYKKGYETHNDQNVRELEAGNDLQHLKWKDGKAGGHIFYDKAN